MDIFTAWASRNMDPSLSQKILARPSDQGRHELGITNDLIHEISNHIASSRSVIDAMLSWELPDDPHECSVEYAVFIGIIQNILGASKVPLQTDVPRLL